MNKILVQQVLPMFIYYGPGHKDNARYAEVLPLDGHQLRPGTLATFNDRNGQKITGKVADWRMQGENVSWDAPGSQVIDTFATEETVESKKPMTFKVKPRVEAPVPQSRRRVG